MKRSAIILVVLTLFLSAIPVVQAGVNPSNSLSGMQLLPADNIWNVPVTAMPVDARSATYIKTIGTSPFLFYTEMYLNVLDNTDGIVPQYLTSIRWPESSDNVKYPIPNPVKIHPSDFDQVLQIYNRATNTYYYMYHAVKASDGTWSAMQANMHDMSSNAIRAGKDLPEIQGEVRYEEVASGSINHAIQATIHHLNDSYVWPYFFHNGEGITDGRYPPVGQRFRLKSSVDISSYPPQAKVIAQAMKTYGIIVTDRHGEYDGIQILAINDPRWCSMYDTSCGLHALSALRNTDFEAVDTSSLMISKNSMQARATSGSPAPTVTPTPTTTPPTAQITASGTVGIYRNGVFYLRNSNTAGIADTVFVYGKAGDVPVTGDWTNSGTDTAGVYRNGVFFLSTGGSGTSWFVFGKAGDIPVGGDWNGDGRDTVGVYRNGVFYLRNSNTGGIADKTFAYGQAGDVPVIGDWNGDGTDSVGVYRNGVFYLRNSNSGGVADMTFAYGQAGDIPVVWHHDGMDTIGVYRSGTFYLKNTNTGGIADIVFVFGQAGDVPVTGTWN